MVVRECESQSVLIECAARRYGTTGTAPTPRHAKRHAGWWIEIAGAWRDCCAAGVAAGMYSWNEMRNESYGVTCETS